MSEGRHPRRPPARGPRSRLGAPTLAALLATLALTLLGLGYGAGLTLEDALRAAADGPDVRLAQHQAAQADAAARAAAQRLTGTLRGGVQGSWNDLGPSPAGDVTVQPLTLQATLYVVPSGPAHDAAERAALAARDAHAAVERVAAVAVVTAAERWWSAERAATALDLARTRRSLAERRLDAVVRQVEAGTAGRAALAEAELALLQARLDVAEAEVDAAAALLELGQVIGGSVPSVAPRASVAVPAANGWLAAVDVVRDERLDAAVAATARVRTAERALADALAAAERARRDADASVAFTAAASHVGDAGRVAVGGAIDSRGRQPSIDLSLDPFSTAPAGTTATLTLAITVPLASSRGATFEQLDLAAGLEAERLVQARALTRLELEAGVRSVDQAAGALLVALERRALRALQVEAGAVGAAAGAVSTLELDATRLELAEADLALWRTLDVARVAVARLEVELGASPLAALGVAPDLLDAPSPAAPEAR